MKTEVVPQGIELLTEAERVQFEADVKKFLDRYAYLSEPFMLDLLHEYEFMKLELASLRRKLHSETIPEKEKISISKRANDLRRVMSLFGNRMGITYVSRQRKKDKIQRKTPFELLQEEEVKK